MSKKKYSTLSRIIVVLAFFAVALLVVGIVLRTRIGMLLQGYTESQTSKQAEAYAMLMEEKLNTELENLGYIASKIETNLDEIDKVIPALYNEQGVRQGLLTIDGDAVYGDKMDVREFEGIQASFRGNKAITFVENQGLMFTYPVFNQSNIRYVLYRMCPMDFLGKSFATEIYDGQGKVCVVTRDGNTVVPFYDNTVKDSDWFMSEEIQNDFRTMHMEMEVSVAVARSFDTDRGEMMLFEAEIPGTDYLVSGFVPKSVAAEGIGNISLLVVWVFGLLMVLVLIGAIYLARASVKVRESNELREAKAIAEEASRAKSDFLANMSHEIRTPINAVLGMDEMILRECSDETITTYANNIKTAGNILLGIVNDILDFSKIEAGKIELIPVNYEVSSLITDLVNLISTRADEKGLLLKLDIDYAIPKQLNGDEVRIKQIITNMLTNAVKYTEKGSVTFRLSYDYSPEDPNSIILQIAISDTGIGIREEDMDKLFSEFERIEEERNRNIEGTGLGMSITRQLIEMMDSSLHVDSVYGEGSCFSFDLKQKVVNWDKLGDYEVDYRESREKKKGYREKFIAPDAEVLVIDDNHMNLMVFKSLLKKTRVRIDLATSGEEGLAMTRGKKYDIIFLDHMMPDKDGIEALHEIREQKENRNAATPIVCLTANAVSGAREKYIEKGFDDYLSKPIESDRLEEMLIEYLPDELVHTPEEVDMSARESAKEELPAFLRDIDEIDMEAGIKNNGDDEETYLYMLKLFEKNADNYVDEVKRLYDSGDIKNATIKIHSLKSTARIIGAMEVGELAQKLEDAGKIGDTETLEAELDDLLSRYRKLGVLLSPLPEIDEKDDGDRPYIDADKLNEYLDRIKTLAEECDDIEIEETLTELSEYRIPEEEKERIDRIKEASENFDFSAITEILS